MLCAALPQGWHGILPLLLQAYLYRLSQQHI
jgi:hypothetical protein